MGKVNNIIDIQSARVVTKKIMGLIFWTVEIIYSNGHVYKDREHFNSLQSALDWAKEYLPEGVIIFFEGRKVIR